MPPLNKVTHLDDQLREEYASRVKVGDLEVGRVYIRKHLYERSDVRNYLTAHIRGASAWTTEEKVVYIGRQELEPHRRNPWHPTVAKFWFWRPEQDEVFSTTCREINAGPEAIVNDISSATDEVVTDYPPTPCH